MVVSRLSSRDYWHKCCRQRSAVQPAAVYAYRNFCVAQTLRIMEKVRLSEKWILEIGGAGSGWPPHYLYTRSVRCVGSIDPLAQPRRV
jgi:hypothetical protein